MPTKNEILIEDRQPILPNVFYDIFILLKVNG